MTIAIFDLDHTLLSADSGFLWGEYMVTNEIIDADDYYRQYAEFEAEYLRGELDDHRYLNFALEPLTRHSIEALHAWRADYVETRVKSAIAEGTPALLDSHRQQGHYLMIISATHLFVTEPIGALLGVDTVLSTPPEIIDNRYTGRYLGTPTHREGKVVALNQWLEDKPHAIEDSYFYSDSVNDLPLLELVDHPVAVNPDEKLLDIARQRNWPVIHLY